MIAGDAAATSGAGRPPGTRKRAPFLAIIDEDSCTGCRICIEFCAVNCIVYVAGEEFPDINGTCRVIEEACIGCKICQRECPWDAIEILDLPRGTSRAEDGVATGHTAAEEGHHPGERERG